MGVLSKMANESSALAVSLLSSKTVMGHAPDNDGGGTIDPSKLSPAAMRELLAARAKSGT